MFNGIIFNTGKVALIKNFKKSKLLGISSKVKFAKNDIGSSISCNGVCLTVISKKKLSYKLLARYINISISISIFIYIFS